MSKRFAAAGLLLAVLALTPSCATTRAVGWSYNLGPTAKERDESVIKPFVAVPLIVLAIGWDASTAPIQLITGT